jgi:hypothetical protein
MYGSVPMPRRDVSRRPSADYAYNWAKPIRRWVSLKMNGAEGTVSFLPDEKEPMMNADTGTLFSYLYNRVSSTPWRLHRLTVYPLISLCTKQNLNGYEFRRHPDLVAILSSYAQNIVGAIVPRRG